MGGPGCRGDWSRWSYALIAWREGRVFFGLVGSVNAMGGGRIFSELIFVYSIVSVED